MSFPVDDKKKKVPSFDEVMKDNYAPPKVPSYDEVMGEKKNLGGNDLKNGLQSSQPDLNVEIPIVSLEDNNAKDIFTLAQEHNDLTNKKESLEQPIGGSSFAMGTTSETEIPDVKAQKQAADLKDYMVNTKGVDPLDVYEEIKDVPKDQLLKHKTELADDREQNNPLYQRKLANLKWRNNFGETLLNEVDKGNIYPDNYNRIKEEVRQLPEFTGTGDFTNQRAAIQSLAKDIQIYGGENKGKILKDFAIEVSKVYGNAYNNKFSDTIKDSPEGKYLNDDEQLALQYIKDVAPDKAGQYDRLMIDPKTLKDNPDALKGYNHLKQTLEETGIGLQQNSVTEELNNLKKQATENDGLTPEQLQRATDLEKKQEELTQKRNELDNKYPDRIENKVDDAVQEIFGQRLGFENYAKLKTVQAFKNTAEGVWEAVSTPFMSDASNNLRELAIMGENIGDENFFHKTDKNKNLLTDQLIIQPELQKQIDAIKNNGVLNESGKQKQITELLKNNLDKFGRVPIKGGKFNINPSSILYGLTDLGTSLLPFVALETVTGGIGGASTAAKFLRTFTAAAATTFHDEYAQAITEGKGQSEAYKRAMGTTAINSLAMAGAATPTEIRAMIGNKSSASKIIAQMSDKAIQEVIDKGTPKGFKGFKQVIKERAKATPAMVGGGLKTGAKFEGYMAGANLINDREVNWKQSVLGIMNFGGMGGILGHIGYKPPTELQKSGILSMGEKPDEFHAALEEMRKDRQLTPEEYDHRKALIESAETAFKSLPKSLDEKQKSEYLYQTVIKNEANKGKSDLPPKQAAEAEHTALVADHTRGLILEPPTDKQLDDRKGILERKLEPKKDAEGKAIELPEKEKLDMEAELEAINNTIENKPKEHPTELSTETPKGNDVVGSEVDFSSKSGNKVINEKGEPITLYHSSFNEVKPFEDGVNYFAEDKQYSQDIAKILVPKGANFVEKPLNTIPVNIKAERIYELPKGKEMNSNVIKELLKDPEFTKKYDAVKGIDLYSENKTVYAVFDKKNIKQITESENKPSLNEEGKDTKDTKQAEGVGEPEKLVSESTPETAAGEEKVTGVKREITDATRAANNMPKVEFPKMGSDVEALNLAKERVDSGKVNPQEMVDRILKDKTNYKNEDEVMDMQYYAHQLQKRNTELNEQLAIAETPEQKLDIVNQKMQLSDLIDAQTEAAQTAGNQWGKTGNRMQPVINDAGQIFRENKNLIKEAYGGEVPKEVQEKLDKLTKERDEAIAAKIKVEEQLRQKMAEKGFEEVKKQAQKQSKNKADKEALKKEEEELLKELKQSLKKDLNNANVGIPIPKETLETLGKLAINYFKQGVNGLEALIDRLYDNLKDTGLTRQQIKEAIANYEPLTIEQETARLNKKADLLMNRVTPPAVDSKGRPTEPVDLAKPPKEQKFFRNNNNWVKANQRVANAEYQMKILKRKAFESKKNLYQKALMWLGRLTRLSVLSGKTVLAKLASAAVIGGAIKRIPEQAIGAIYSKAFKGIAEKAPIEGYWNAKSEAKFYKEFFDPKKFVQNSWEILKSGSTDLGKRLGGAEYEHVPVLYLPTDLHQIIKDPLKRAAYESSFRNSIIWAEKNGLDINDPLVINSIENASYKRAQYEIFQESNKLSRWFVSQKAALEKNGNAGATAKFVVDFLIPVSTVPTNIVRRVGSTSPVGMIRGTAKVIEAYRKGISTLTNEEAESIMKQLKQGTLGTALWLTGWFAYKSFGGLYSQFNPNKKREEGDKMSDVMVVNGEEIPKPIQHALPLEVILVAATARRIYENYKENKNAGTGKALLFAGLGSIGALGEQIPIIETPIHAALATQDPVEADKLKEDIIRRVEPQALREFGAYDSDFKTSKEGKYLDDKGLKIVDIHKEAVHPVDSEGNKIKVSDEKFNQLVTVRERKIQEAIADARKNGFVNWETGETIDADKITPAQLKEWLMSQSTKAKNEAIDEVFGEQPDKAEKQKWETNQ